MADSSHAPINFLLVDDRDANLVALERLLRRDGLHLLKARSGPEALELLLKHDVALALVDVQMPGMDGFELAELMRGSDRTRRVPIVFITAGHSDQKRRFRGYETGAVDFLQKPIENDVLKSKASVFFDLHTERQEVQRQRDEMERINLENARLLEESRQFAAALQDADQRKDEFLATLAHELRNPLSPILNGIQLLGLLQPDDETESEEAQENAEIREMIERQVHHMVRLVDDLLEVSRITSGKIHLQTERIELAQVLRHAVETSRPNIVETEHQLDILMPDEKVFVNGDMTRLAQVVSNLLNNSARYTPSGGRITLTLESRGDHAKIKVGDNGIGIPTGMLDKVFELFAQVNRQHKQANGGLGIGLALVKHLVELHQGTVSVHSDGENCGAEFTVNIPLLQPEPAFAEPVTLTRTDRNHGIKVMAVDDNTDALKSLSRLLIAMGHDVATADTGPEGIELFETFQPRCVFLDIGMPEMDGCEVARRIRRLPGGGDACLVALTGWGQEEDRARTEAAGFDHHAVKPIAKDAIRALLDPMS